MRFGPYFKNQWQLHRQVDLSRLGLNRAVDQVLDQVLQQMLDNGDDRRWRIRQPRRPGQHRTAGKAPTWKVKGNVKTAEMGQARVEQELKDRKVRTAQEVQRMANQLQTKDRQAFAMRNVHPKKSLPTCRDMLSF